jgi:hypothetical protein
VRETFYCLLVPLHGSGSHVTDSQHWALTGFDPSS